MGAIKANLVDLVEAFLNIVKSLHKVGWRRVLMISRAYAELAKRMFNVIRLKGTPEDNVSFLVAAIITVISVLFI